MVANGSHSSEKKGNWLLMLNKMKVLRFFTVSIRVFLGLIFFSSGMGKLLPFPGIIGPVWLEAELAQYGLGMFARFIAYSQITVGLLLLSQRFATLGAVMLFPIVLNIFMVTVSMNWRGTPYVLAFFMLLNIYLLIMDYHKLKFLLTDQPEALKAIPLRRRFPKKDLFWGIGMALILGSTLIYPLNALMAYVMIGGSLVGFLVINLLRVKQSQ